MKNLKTNLQNRMEIVLIQVFNKIPCKLCYYSLIYLVVVHLFYIFKVYYNLFVTEIMAYLTYYNYNRV